MKENDNKVEYNHMIDCFKEEHDFGTEPMSKICIFMNSVQVNFIIHIFLFT